MSVLQDSRMSSCKRGVALPAVPSSVHSALKKSSSSLTTSSSMRVGHALQARLTAALLKLLRPSRHQKGETSPVRLIV